MTDTNDMPNDFVSWVVSGNSNIRAGTRWDSETVQSHLSAWQAATERATAIERERCAKVCEVECALLGGIAAGPMVTGFGKHTHQSMASGAKNCAAAIRQGGAG